MGIEGRLCTAAHYRQGVHLTYELRRAFDLFAEIDRYVVRWKQKAREKFRAIKDHWKREVILMLEAE